LGAKTRDELDCENCKFVIPLMAENEEAVSLIEKVMPGLVSNGQVNYGAIESVFRVYDIPKWRQPELFEKLHIYVILLLEHIQEKTEEKLNAGRNSTRSNS